MKKWKIVTDSGSDFRTIDNLSDKVDFAFVPLMLNIDNEVIVDNGTIDNDTLNAKLEAAKGATSSACPSPDSYARTYVGAENVIVFTLTGGLSGSYNSARLGKDIFEEEHPDVNVHIFDSRSASGEMNLLIEKALELAEAEVEFEEMLDALNAYHQHTQIVFLLESVNNLVKNGRVNKIVGQMIGLLNIRLVGVRTEQGTIDIAHKARGAKRGYESVLKEMESNGYQGGKVSLSHVANLESAKHLKALIKERFKEAHVTIQETSNLCSYYAEKNGLILGYETK